VGTVDAYWAANLDLASTTPELNMYDKDWPIWTYQEQLPPAKFVHDANGRVGRPSTRWSRAAASCRARVCASRCCSPTCWCARLPIEEAVVLPDVQINRHCRLRNVVIDRRCKMPEGLVIGEDPALDAQRFDRTENGVVLVTRGMLARF
jgi:glucose-1-phosphate adenylyltransferase